MEMDNGGEGGGGLGIDQLATNDQFDFITKLLAFEQDDDQFDLYNTSPYKEININTSYIDIDSIPTSNSNRNKSLLIMSLNIQSLASKFNEFSDLISHLSSIKKSPDIICLQELWQIIDPDLFDLDGYQPLKLNTRSNIRGGGVGIFVKNKFNCKTLDQLSIFNERIFESIFVEVSGPNGKKIVVGSIYRPGTQVPGLTFNEQFNQFSDNFSNALSNLSHKYESVFICGDLNLDLLKLNENKYIRDYIDLTFANGFIQIVSKPTRISNTSATVIDHILTNHLPNEYETMILCNHISDHFPILFWINADINCTNIPSTISTRNFSAQNTEHFISAMMNMSWNHVLLTSDTQTAFDSFSNTFFDIFNLYFPLKTKKINKRYHKIEPWITTGILNSRRTKILLNNRSIKNPTHHNINKFKQYRNIYNLIIRKAKKLYFNNKILEYKNNLKKTWQTLFTVIKKGKKKKQLQGTF